jgi:MSHA biogenesis protein MshI
MKFPWKRSKSTDRVAVSWDGNAFAYVQTSAMKDSKFIILKCGVERLGDLPMPAFIAKLKSLHLSGCEVVLQLSGDQYSLLQIDSPPVPDADLKTACRYEIKDLIDGHIDEFSIDVIRLGDGSNKGPGQAFVAAAKKDVIKSMTSFCKQIGLSVNVVDIQETAQRNLQTLYVRENGFGSMAVASVSVVSDHQALLTISANDELYYFRRLEIPNGFIDEEWGSGFEMFPDDDAQEEQVSDLIELSVDELSYDSYTSAIDITPDDEKTSKIVIEIQRSLDLWDRTWRSMPLVGKVCFCGNRSVDLSGWLSQEMNQLISNFFLADEFRSIFLMDTRDQILCLPLAGSLLREPATSQRS